MVTSAREPVAVGEAPATVRMFDIVCGVDHSTDGSPAGRVFARVRELGDTVARCSATQPGCALMAIEVQAPLGSQHGELTDAEAPPKDRRSAIGFEQPVRPGQPVFPRGRGGRTPRRSVSADREWGRPLDRRRPSPN